MIAPSRWPPGQNAYFVGKPNPLMMRTGLRILGVHSEEAAMIGDRMDTDMVAGIESGLDTVLVLSGHHQPVGHQEVPVPAPAGAGRRGGYPRRDGVR